jgi:hypothetical protein
MRMADCHPDQRHEAKGLCLPCYQASRRDAKREWAARPENRGRKNAVTRAKRNADIKAARAAEAQQRDNDRTRRYMRRYSLSKYGITVADFDRMVASQDGRCWICRCVPPSTLCVDHDHKTGVVRGLLCRPCNSTLGRHENDPLFLSRMVEYLKSATRAQCQA